MSESGWELEHRYGPRVHVLDNLHLLTLVSRVSGNDVRHPELPQLVRTIYLGLFLAASGRELPPIDAAVPTRMMGAHPNEGIYRGPILDPGTRAVIVDIVRGGIIPAQTCFEMLCSVLPDENVRLDHLSMQRVADDDGRVAGVDLTGSKIGGSIEGSFLFLPDPMGATGSTTIRAIEHYAESFGRPAKIVAMPMIATPEYLRAVLAATPDLVVYTTRIDRGLSPPDVLATVPGTHWDRERGLNEHGYIVPGAGGMGEVLNNAWV